VLWFLTVCYFYEQVSYARYFKKVSVRGGQGLIISGLGRAQASEFELGLLQA
jgi:hypothetical protein